MYSTSYLDFSSGASNKGPDDEGIQWIDSLFLLPLVSKGRPLPLVQQVVTRLRTGDHVHLSGEDASTWLGAEWYLYQSAGRT